jgi:hypothetical protein
MDAMEKRKIFRMPEIEPNIRARVTDKEIERDTAVRERDSDVGIN